MVRRKSACETLSTYMCVCNWHSYVISISFHVSSIESRYFFGHATVSIPGKSNSCQIGGFVSPFFLQFDHLEGWFYNFYFLTQHVSLLDLSSSFAWLVFVYRKSFFISTCLQNSCKIVQGERHPKIQQQSHCMKINWVFY